MMKLKPKKYDHTSRKLENDMNYFHPRSKLEKFQLNENYFDIRCRSLISSGMSEL